jgi:alpha-L-fucosidase
MHKDKRIMGNSSKFDIFVILVLSVLAARVYSQTPAAEPNESKEIKSMSEEERTKWFRHDKFGMFVHWGLYSIPAGEWKGKQIPGIGEWIMNRARIPVTEYEQLAKLFNPVEFNAEQWVKVAKDAGIKYIVITSKHHDGFAMYHSKVSKYNVVDATPFGRDPMTELAQACKKEGVRFCFYYSQDQDWHEPDGTGNSWDWPDESKKNFTKYFNEKAVPQVKEILTQYGPIGLIWFDTPRKISREQSVELTKLVHQLQPACLVNSRVGNDIGDYKSVGDSEIPRTPLHQAWETCVSLNNTWGYKKDDTDWKSPKVVIHKLVKVVSKGGNYLLNVGPTAQGIIPEGSVKVLQEVGRWMDKNSESVYGTTDDVFGPLPWGTCTVKPGVLYLHVFDWPQNGKLPVPGLKNKVNKAYFLVDKQKPLVTSRVGDNVIVEVGDNAPDKNDTVIVLEIVGTPDVDPVHVLMNNYNNGFESFEGTTAGQAKLVSRGWMEAFGDWHYADFISNWSRPEDKVKWEFKAPEAGKYKIEVAYSTDEEPGNNKFIVNSDKQRFAFECIGTGKYTSIKTIEVGELAIPNAGSYTISVGLAAEGKSSVYIKSVILLSTK